MPKVLFSSLRHPKVKQGKQLDRCDWLHAPCEASVPTKGQTRQAPSYDTTRWGSSLVLSFCKPRIPRFSAKPSQSVSYSKKWESAAQRPETETLNNGVFNVACVGPEAQDLRRSSFFSPGAFQSDVSRPGAVLTLKKERA